MAINLARTKHTLHDDDSNNNNNNNNKEDF